MKKMDSDIRLFKVKLAQEAERFDDMAAFITEIVTTENHVTNSEIELLSVAYKNSVMSRRLAYKVVAEMDSKEYQTTIRDELKAICNKLLDVVDKRLIPNAIDVDVRVVLFKLIGDFNRYLAEVTEDEGRQEYAENAMVAYKEASELALSELPPTSTARLGTALNFSVFFYDILQKKDKAQEIAKAAYNDAVNQLGDLTDNTYRDTVLALQLLKENLVLWEKEEK